MANAQALHSALVDFATRLTSRFDLDAVLHDLCDRAIEALELDGAGLTIGPDPAAGHMQFVTATDAATEHLERKQDEFREGVCFDAAKENAPVLVSALQDTNKWPRFTPVALDVGFSSAAGFPMRTDNELIGVLNAYRVKAGPWTAEDVAAGQTLAQVATTYVTNAGQLVEARRINEQLQKALDSRVVIEQAKGMLAERLGVAPDTGFDLIRTYARSNRRQLRHVAHEVLTGRLFIGD